MTTDQIVAQAVSEHYNPGYTKCPICGDTGYFRTGDGYVEPILEWECDCPEGHEIRNRDLCLRNAERNDG